MSTMPNRCESADSYFNLVALRPQLLNYTLNVCHRQGIVPRHSVPTYAMASMKSNLDWGTTTASCDQQVMESLVPRAREGQGVQASIFAASGISAGLSEK